MDHCGIFEPGSTAHPGQELQPGTRQQVGKVGGALGREGIELAVQHDGREVLGRP
jgi:hypothetical protein